MARIAFLPLAQTSHTNSTFKLARQLRARGHHISYLALPEMEEKIRSQGWDFTPIFGHLFPKTFREEVEALYVSKAPIEEKRAMNREMMRRTMAHFEEALFSADFEARLRESRADLVLVDATFPIPALTALRLGIRAAIFSSTFPLWADVGVWPLRYPHPPPGDGWSRLKVRALWGWYARFPRGPYNKFTREQLRRFSRQFPGLGRLCDFRTHLQHGPHVNITTLVASCSELDFPRRSLENLHYIGPGVDLERAEAPLPPEVDREGPPLLYCSLGSHGYRASQHRPFFQVVLDTLARRTDWRLLLVLGKNLNPADFRIPPNVTVMASAPQLAALRKATLMITHGGLNTVKECICLGVPMIVLPTTADQPGNGARIAHHGLGLVGDIRRVTPESLSSMIDAVARDPGYRARVRTMQELFLAANESARGPEVIERVLAEPLTSVLEPGQAPAS